MAMNPRIKAPAAPGEHCDQEFCYGCGESYEEFRLYFSFAEAADLIRHKAFGEGDEGGGWRSRGPVLWVMRVMKLNAWYDKHSGCGMPAISDQRSAISDQRIGM